MRDREQPASLPPEPSAPPARVLGDLAAARALIERLRTALTGAVEAARTLHYEGNYSSHRNRFDLCPHGACAAVYRASRAALAEPSVPSPAEMWWWCTLCSAHGDGLNVQSCRRCRAGSWVCRAHGRATFCDTCEAEPSAPPENPDAGRRILERVREQCPGGPARVIDGERWCDACGLQAHESLKMNDTIEVSPDDGKTWDLAIVREVEDGRPVELLLCSGDMQGRRVYERSCDESPFMWRWPAEKACGDCGHPRSWHEPDPDDGSPPLECSPPDGSHCRCMDWREPDGAGGKR